MKHLMVLCLSILTLYSCSSNQKNSNFPDEKVELPKEYNFLSNGDFTSVRLSPDGKKLALFTETDLTPRVTIFDLKSMKPILSFGFPQHGNLTSREWVNSDKLLIFINSMPGYRKDKKSLINYALVLNTNDKSTKKSTRNIAIKMITTLTPSDLEELLVIKSSFSSLRQNQVHQNRHM
jgi:hypothetical protein